MNPDDEISRMERGEAGTSFSTAATETSEKSYENASTSKTLSFHSPNTRRKNLRTPRWIRTARTRLRKGWNGPSRQASNPPQNVSNPTIRTLSASPQGYPRLAAFLDSDESFMIYRRFGFIQSRLILDKQDELRELEKRLDKLDRVEAKIDERWPRTRDLPDEHLERRTELLKEVEETFCSYVNLLNAARKMVAMNHPSKVDYNSVRNWMRLRNPLMEREASWIDHEEDMVTLRAGREHAWLDSSIETFLRWFHCPLLEQVFGDERSRTKSSGTKSPGTKSSDIEVYYSRQQVTRLANCIITAMILILLIVPIYILYHLINDVKTDKAYAICIGVLVVATLAFSAVLSLFTKAKRHEILAAAAA
ncbi:hypothetical protein DPSP01_006126 [Paraphaeosphaeria sporulosa]